MTMIECADGIAVLTLDRPHNKELTGTFDELRNDDSLRVVILTGSGDAFCAGTDISELPQLIESFPVPVIAIINGIAAGAGYELALACHLRIASKKARFNLPDGNELDAAAALQLGLLNRLVEPDQLLVESRALAKQIAALAPLAIRACLKAVTAGLKLPFEEGLELERELFASLFATEDAKEGTRAFLQKRRAVFKGK